MGRFSAAFYSAVYLVHYYYIDHYRHGSSGKFPLWHWLGLVSFLPELTYQIIYCRIDKMVNWDCPPSARLWDQGCDVTDILSQVIYKISLMWCIRFSSGDFRFSSGDSIQGVSHQFMLICTHRDNGNMAIVWAIRATIWLSVYDGI